jgi:undecaprenyl-diphosphatase
MSIGQALILGIVQGLTEFLPVSSSGHLVLVPYWLGWEFDPAEAFAFDVFVQLGTLVAVIGYFWGDLKEIIRAMFLQASANGKGDRDKARLGWLLAVAILPAALLGFLFREQVQLTFEQPAATGWFLLGTALLLVMSEQFGKRNVRIEVIRSFDALIIGVFQALALFPGLSRSGATITGGMLRGLERPAAARFSFLLAVPIMLGAGLFAMLEFFTTARTDDVALPFLAGFLAAAISGYLVIRWLLKFLAERSLYGFALYCTLVGVLTLLTTR